MDIVACSLGVYCNSVVRRGETECFEYFAPAFVDFEESVCGELVLLDELRSCFGATFQLVF